MLKEIAFSLGVALLAHQASAHSDGHGTIEPDAALVSAVEATHYLAVNEIDRTWSPLSESWKYLPKSSAEILALVDGDYVIAVTNPKTSEVFYILIAGNGAIVDANFTGTFPFVWDLQTDGALSEQ
ncbi:hypothetical protein KUV73_00950 [Mameliella alba]|nr:hypothetical protein [Mameliella alba]MBY6167881.1 hypothetical protein [Mameliella alba]MBY6172902.1 hypothetical protein [Mameliella alba]